MSPLAYAIATASPFFLFLSGFLVGVGLAAVVAFINAAVESIRARRHG